jgi:hypothetical protein
MRLLTIAAPFACGGVALAQSGDSDTPPAATNPPSAFPADSTGKGPSDAPAMPRSGDVNPRDSASGTTSDTGTGTDTSTSTTSETYRHSKKSNSRSSDSGTSGSSGSSNSSGTTRSTGDSSGVR